MNGLNITNSNNSKSKHKGNILVVDDNPTNLSLLFKYLKDSGYKLYLIESGESALEQIGDIKPDLILLDIRMPQLDGFEVCKILKANKKTKDIPVIFMTALSEDEDKIKGFNMGAVDYVTKPLHYEEVLARVNTHMTIRLLQLELEQQNEELQKLNLNKNKFFSIISHDIKSPLNAVIMFSKLLMEQKENISVDEPKQLVELLYDASKNVYDFIDKLLLWSKVQMERVDYNPELHSIKELILNTISILSNYAERKNITIINNANTDIETYVDKEMIMLVLRNLISNAIKFTKSGGKVEITVIDKNDFIEISISDSGIGIDESNLAKLFRLDSQYRRVGTDEESGTGLGLILCKDFIDKHNGEIRAESKENQGSTFTFTLPSKSTSGVSKKLTLL